MPKKHNWFKLVDSIIQQRKKVNNLKKQLNTAHDNVCETMAQSCPIDLNCVKKSCIMEIYQIDASGDMTLRIADRKFCEHFSETNPCNQECEHKQANNEYCDILAQYKMAYAKYKDLINRVLKPRTK